MIPGIVKVINNNFCLMNIVLDNVRPSKNPPFEEITDFTATQLDSLLTLELLLNLEQYGPIGNNVLSSCRIKSAPHGIMLERRQNRMVCI